MNKLYWLAAAFLTVYIFSMVIYPIWDGGGDWRYVQNVWDRWQGLNVGVLAFASSIIAFSISRYNADKQREREFTATRAFLPHALSELCRYIKPCSLVLIEAYKGIRASARIGIAPLTARVPNLPSDYKEIFSRCIEKAEPNVGDYLSDILRKLQVHHSRITEIESDFDNAGCDLDADNIKSYLYSLALLQAMIDKLFPYARGTGKFDDSVPTFDSLYGIYVV